jgi:YbbR domain-containing protein
MLRYFSENLGLKVMALIASIMIWLYASAERNPVMPKRVNAEVVAVGSAPRDLIVRLKSDLIPIEISGPRSEVDSIGDKDIKAYINLASVRADDREVQIVDLKGPSSTPNISFPHPRQSVPADVIPKQTKSFVVEPVYNRNNPLGKVYGTPKLEPTMVSVSGSQSELQRVVKLHAYIEARGSNVREDVRIHAVDKDGIDVNGVLTDPPQVHVELSLEEVQTTRSLIVSVRTRGKPATPYVPWEVIANPDQITVSGKPEQLLQMTNLSTAEVDVEGLMGETVRNVPLQLPDGITVKDGPNRVKVTIRLRDLSKPSP